jgi:hypothetical protein
MRHDTLQLLSQRRILIFASVLCVLVLLVAGTFASSHVSPVEASPVSASALGSTIPISAQTQNNLPVIHKEKPRAGKRKIAKDISTPLGE